MGSRPDLMRSITTRHKSKCPIDFVYAAQDHDIKKKARSRLALTRTLTAAECQVFDEFDIEDVHLDSEHWGYFLKTDPDPTAMVIKVELFIHKPCQTEASCKITSTSNRVVPICICLAGLVDK